VEDVAAQIDLLTERALHAAAPTSKFGERQTQKNAKHIELHGTKRTPISNVPEQTNITQQTKTNGKLFMIGIETITLSACVLRGIVQLQNGLPPILIYATR
jgi:hypothetical protein